MKQSEQIHFLNEALLAEMPQYRQEAKCIHSDEKSQRASHPMRKVSVISSAA